MAEWHRAFEEYCETIFELNGDDISVIQARSAERFLPDILGWSCADSHGEAEKWEHVTVVSRCVISRIPEELEFTPGMLDLVEESSMTPGSARKLTAAGSDGAVTVEIGGRQIGVDAFASQRVLVHA
jgi:hypothetical protein